LIGTIISSSKATLYELQSIYGVEDAHNLLEIITVDRHNEAVSHGDDN
jgi:hypothetical protein